MTVTDTVAPLIALNIWGHEPDPAIIQTIHRFGIEYEMFPRHYNGNWESSDWCCEECDGPRVPVSATGKVAEYIARASAAGLAHNHVHEYHCNCTQCRYDRPGPLMATQADNSVAVEMVSRILDVRNTTDMDEVAQWVAFVESWKADGHWMPDGVTNCGNHIHVGRRNTTGTIVLGDPGINFIQAAYAAYNWEGVADGGCGKIRGYNSKPRLYAQTYTSSYFSGSWMSAREHTVEHRLWNTPRDPERVWAHLGLSIALTRWGVQAQQNDPDMKSADGTWIIQYADRIDDFKRDVIAYLPDGPCFEQAAQLLNDHLVNY